MSEIKPLQTVTQLAEARRAAAACGHVDINSTVQQCPASQGQLFVVPVRYALSEEPANHAAFQPGVDTQSHPMAARSLRVGFIYVWQGNGPLQRYAVAENSLLRQQALDEDDTVVTVGNLSGLALAKHQSAWMLYSEIPLNPQHCDHAVFLWVLANAEGDVVGHAQVREQRVVLKHHADPAFLRREGEAGTGDHVAGQADFTFMHRFKPGNRAQGRGFAATG